MKKFVGAKEKGVLRGMRKATCLVLAQLKTRTFEATVA